MAILALSLPAAADAAKPAKGGRYIGLNGLDSIGRPGDSSFFEPDSRLRVSRSGRRLRRSSYVLTECGAIRLRRSRRRTLRIRSNGRFRLVKRRGRLRVRLRGRFVSRGHAKLVYTVRKTRGRCVARRQRVGLYLNGQPPFTGCRTQRAAEVARGPTGRVFEQDRYVRDGFYPHLYACLYATNKRFRLGQNYDEQIVEPVDLAGPYVGFYNGSIVVRDLRTGAVFHDVSSGLSYNDRVASLQVKENGSVGWILSSARQVYAFDAVGRRLLDSGPGIQTNSLRLSGSTLSWIKNGAVRSAPLN